MKRTISLIIAIAVMISMFVLPASAAEYIVDMSTLNGASAFTAAVNIPIPGITLSDIGLHFETGEPGATNGNTVDIPLDLSGYNTMTITYRTGAAVGVECEKLMLQKADYSASYSTFDIKGSGGWGTTAEASIDVSAITEGTTNYRLTLQDNGTGNGLFVTGIKLTTDTISGGGGVTPPPAGDTVTTVDGIVAGNSTLGADISGIKSISSGTYVIDLAGYKWTGRLLISGTADVTIMDSSAGKTGLIDASQMGDAIDVSGSAKLTLDAVKVIGAVNEGDAIFVSGGTVVSNNSILTAGKAGIDVTSASASVTVNGGSFPEFTYGAKNERNSAIELRWNATVTLNGDIDFTVNRIVARKTENTAACHTNAIADSIVCGANASAAFTAETAVVDPYPNYNVTEITYIYTTVAGDPAFVDGAAISLTGGLTINFLAENITANEYVMVGDVRVDAEYKTAGEYAGYYVFAFGDFGPQEMGDDFTAELYSNGVVVDSMTYSVADYCYAVIEDSSSSATLVKLAKATLNYGAAAQKYRNYKINNLVNANLSAADQSPWYAAWAAEPTVGNDSSVHAQYLWHRANVHFADKLSLVVTFKADYAVEVTDAPDHVVCIWDINDRSQDQILDVTDLGDGEYQVTVTDILPTQYQLYFCFYVVAESGEQLTDELNFSISSYIELNDYYLEGENEDYGYYEPIGPINDLVRALAQYGEAAEAYVA